MYASDGKDRRQCGSVALWVVWQCPVPVVGSKLTGQRPPYLAGASGEGVSEVGVPPPGASAVRSGVAG